MGRCVTTAILQPRAETILVSSYLQSQGEKGELHITPAQSQQGPGDRPPVALQALCGGTSCLQQMGLF